MKKIVVILAVIILIVLAVVIINIIRTSSKVEIQEATKDIAQVNNTDTNTILNQTIVEPPKDYVQVSKDGTKENKSTGITSDKFIKNLKISDIKLTNDGKDTVFKAKVNTVDGSEIENEKILKIDFIKEDGTKWISIEGVIIKSEPKTEGMITTKILDFDITNAHDIEITEK